MMSSLCPVAKTAAAGAAASASVAAAAAVICRWECTVVHVEANGQSNSECVGSYVQHGKSFQQNHSRQAFTTSVVGLVKAVSN